MADSLPVSKELRANIIEVAVTKGASVETLERLLALQERWEATEARKAFDVAIAEVKPLLPELKKNHIVDFTNVRGQRTRYVYENLSDMVTQFAPILAAHGLSFKWRTKSDAKSVHVTCILSHSQGHSEETELSCGHDNTGNKNEIQAIGSAVSYLQRYTLKAALGVAASDDDDGQSADALKRTAQHAGPPKEDPRPREAIKSERSQLGVDLLAYCNADKDRASQMLFELTGKRSIKEVDNEQAKKARVSLHQLMEQRQPGPDDDFPDFKSPEEQAKADEKTAELFDAERAKPEN